MLIVIPDNYRRSLIVEAVPNDYGKHRRDEINKLLISYFAMLRFALSTNRKPPFAEGTAENTIAQAIKIIASRTSQHIQKVETENNYLIDNLAQSLVMQEQGELPL